MWPLCGLIMGCILLGAALWWARQDGQKAARLQALKKEAQEAARVQQVINKVDRLPDNVVRNCLRHKTD